MGLPWEGEDAGAAAPDPGTAALRREVEAASFLPQTSRSREGAGLQPELLALCRN